MGRRVTAASDWYARTTRSKQKGLERGSPVRSSRLSTSTTYSSSHAPSVRHLSELSGGHLYQLYLSALSTVSMYAHSNLLLIRMSHRPLQSYELEPIVFSYYCNVETFRLLTTTLTVIMLGIRGVTR